MKKLTKILMGVVFVVVLLSSLIITAPASAGVQAYSFATRPSDANAICAIGTYVLDFAVAESNVNVVYAATNEETLKSVDQGRSWAEIHLGAGGVTLAAELVAIAPDDANIVAYATNLLAGLPNVWISFNGGQNFFDLGRPKRADGTNPVTTIKDIDVSRAYTDLWGNTYHVVGVAGIGVAGGGVGTSVAYFQKVGAYAPYDWEEVTADWNIIAAGEYTAAATNVQFFAIHFSPAFNIDNICYLLEQRLAVGGTIVSYHAACLNIPGPGHFNLGISGYAFYAPAGTPVTGAGIVAPTKGQIIFDPGYSGVYYSPYARTAYCSVGTGAAAGGAFSMVEDASFTPSAFPIVGAVSIWSIGLNATGTTLVAAQDLTNVVWTKNLLSPAPAAPNLAIKRIGGNLALGIGFPRQTIFFAGANVLCAKQDRGAAFSLSINNGYNFNDISLVNMDLATLDDQAIKEDGTERYVFARGGTYASALPGLGAINGPMYIAVFYYGPDEVDGTHYYWERTFVRDIPTNTFVCRASPVSFSTLYLGEQNNGTIYYTSSFGRYDWAFRLAPMLATTLADLEVVNDAQLYVAVNIGFGCVCPLTYSGMWWNASDYIQVFSGALIASITLVDDDSVVAGSRTGLVAYTTSGGNTPVEWTLIAPTVGQAGWVYADAFSLTPGSVIYAVEDSATAIAGQFQGVWGYVVGSPATAAWFPVYMPFDANTVGNDSYDVFIDQSDAADACIYYMGIGDTDLTGAVSNNKIFARSFLSDALIGGWRSVLLNAYTPGNAPDVMYGTTDASGILGNQIWFIDTANTPRYTAAMKSWGYWLGGYPQMIIYTDELAAVPPALSSPIDGYIVQVNAETGTAYNTVLQWTHAVHFGFGLTYRLQVALDAAFTVPVINAVGLFPPVIIGPWVTPPSVLQIVYQPGEIYYWRVRAETPFLSRWSQVFTLNIQAAPIPVPILYTPTNGGVVNTLTPSFSWSPMSGTAVPSGITTTYTIQLGTGPDFANPAYFIDSWTATNTTAFVLPPGYLVDGSTYYWRIGTTVTPPGNWSATSVFTVDLSAGQTTTTITQTSTAVPSTIAVPSGSATHTDNVVNPSYIWAIIIIGAVLVVAILILIWRIRK